MVKLGIFEKHLAFYGYEMSVLQVASWRKLPVMKGGVTLNGFGIDGHTGRPDWKNPMDLLKSTL
jgi:hypothetical protein